MEVVEVVEVALFFFLMLASASLSPVEVEVASSPVEAPSPVEVEVASSLV